MKRNKEWWARLTPAERSQLVRLERSHRVCAIGGGGYLPDDCAECSYCDTPHFGISGLCSGCLNDLHSIISKANHHE